MQQHVKTKQHKNKWPAAGYSLPTHVLEFKCRNNSLLSTPYLTQHREALIKCLTSWTVLWYPWEGSLPSWFTCSAGAVLKAIQYVSYWLTHVNHSLRKYSPSTYFVPGNSPGDCARVVNKQGNPGHAMYGGDWDKVRCLMALTGITLAVNQHSLPFFFNVFLRPFVKHAAQFRPQSCSKRSPPLPTTGYAKTLSQGFCCDDCLVAVKRESSAGSSQPMDCWRFLI